MYINFFSFYPSLHLRAPPSLSPCTPSLSSSPVQYPMVSYLATAVQDLYASRVDQVDPDLKQLLLVN